MNIPHHYLLINHQCTIPHLQCLRAADVAACLCTCLVKGQLKLGLFEHGTHITTHSWTCLVTSQIELLFLENSTHYHTHLHMPCY
jgi:hypothetical protein